MLTKVICSLFLIFFAATSVFAEGMTKFENFGNSVESEEPAPEKSTNGPGS